MLLSAMGQSQRAKRDRHKADHLHGEVFPRVRGLCSYAANLTTVPIFVACTVTLPALANSLNTLPTCAGEQPKAPPKFPRQRTQRVRQEMSAMYLWVAKAAAKIGISPQPASLVTTSFGGREAHLLP
jgi:hypothetical protein